MGMLTGLLVHTTEDSLLFDRFTGDPYEDSFSSAMRPGEATIDDGVQKRVYNWGDYPYQPSAKLKRCRSAGHWAVQWQGEQPSAGKASFLIFLWSLCRDMLAGVFARLHDTEASVAKTKASEAERQLCPTDTQILLLELPRVSLAGLPSDATHYAPKNADSLTARLFQMGASFLNQKSTRAPPREFEIQTEILVYCENLSAGGDVLNGLFTWNGLLSDPVPSAANFVRNLVKLPKNLLDKNWDNFLAIPGTTIPIDGEGLSESIRVIKARLAKDSHVECTACEFYSAKFSNIEDSIQSSPLWANERNLTDPHDECDTEDSHLGRLMRPVLELELSNEIDWKVQRIAGNVMIPCHPTPRAV
mmetsp:Transcript_24408/g.38014  ORF Transcript_24408/g.38014 Transcript_24408/m.38014 type:complete len:360 (-) Transcript_24408:56-1135(-)